jgi:hypothetical protein
MIVAHRLLKNSIDNNEYLLMTEKLLEQVADATEPGPLKWASASEEYPSIGKVAYRFTLLNESRKDVPEPPAAPPYRKDSTPYLEIPIAANYMDVYMTMMNIPGRPLWMPHLQKVGPDTPDVFVGSIHYCTFADYQTMVSPLQMSVSEGGITYAESCRMEERNLSLVYEYVFKKTEEKACTVATRFMNAHDSPLPEETKAVLFERMQQMAEDLKAYCEKKEPPV